MRKATRHISFLKNGYIKPWNTSSVCAVCVCVDGSVGGGQEWAMRMKRYRENKYVKSREPGSVVVTGHGQKEDINLVL